MDTVAVTVWHFFAKIQWHFLVYRVCSYMHTNNKYGHHLITLTKLTQSVHYKHSHYFSQTFHCWGTRWRSLLMHCATSRKVAGSITDGVIGIFHWHNPSGHTVALELTQLLTEMSTRDISWGKGGRCVQLTTLPPSCADCLQIWEPQLPGTLGACPGCNGIALFHCYIHGHQGQILCPLLSFPWRWLWM